VTNASLRVLFLAAEAEPFIKIGGLGDVAGSLPRALRQIAPVEEGGIDVRLAIPFHGVIQQKNYPARNVATFNIPSTHGPVKAEVLAMEQDGLPVYFISGPPIRPESPIYSPDARSDGYKFTFFSLASLEFLRQIDWVPHIIHANDWHTAPAVYAVDMDRRQNGFFKRTATVLGLHNLPYLGVGTEGALQQFGLPPAIESSLPEWARSLPLPLGLNSADRIVAVSPTYAKEILTPEFGSGLNEFLRTRAASISGILNGIDTERWNPQIDPALPANYNLNNLTARDHNKIILQKELSLTIDPRVPLFGMVSRMDNQKGVDLVPDAFRKIARQPWQAVILGTGDAAIEAAVRRLETEFPEQVRAAIRFDAALSRRIFGGVDVLLIPSRYEPCGLTQMIAMRYGCIPLARATGGLRDTIIDFKRSDRSTGFLFHKASPEAFARTLRRSIKAFQNSKVWQDIQERGMSQDFSWEHSARQYLALYQSLVKNQGV
jgi:starch synthase